MIVQKVNRKISNSNHTQSICSVIGQQQVQGLDYAYTLEGCLKGVNSTTLQSAAGSGVLTDIGSDGVGGSPNQFVAQDAYGFNWNVYGKLQSTQKTDGTNINYTYDAAGNRISKTVSGANGYTEWYVRDASGNIMGVYNIAGTSITQTEQHLYGSSRLGIYNRNIDADTSLPAGTNANLIGKYYVSFFARGNKQYEFSDHRGSVLLTASDKKIPYSSNGTTVDYYNADIISATDYSTFGAISRSFNAGLATNAFDGQRLSPEISPTAQTAEFWEYNGDVGRRWNLDPKPTMGLSEYATFFNNPILSLDILGDTASPHESAQMVNDSYNSFGRRRKIDGGWTRLSSYPGVVLENKGNGFQSAIYSRTTNGKTEFAFAMAGTQDIKDIGQDGLQLIGLSKQNSFAILQAENLSNSLKKGTELTLMGHSLGGSDAAAAALATGRPAITFNAAGVSYLTKLGNGLLGKSSGNITAFRIPGEIVGPLQGAVLSSADGRIVFIHPVFGKMGKISAKVTEEMTPIIISFQLHKMSQVFKALEQSGYGSRGEGELVNPPLLLPETKLPHDADNTINRL